MIAGGRSRGEERVTDIAAEIRQFITTEFAGDARPSVTDSTPLIDEGVIDSLGIFIVVDFLKDRFDIEVEPEEVTVDNFETVGAIAGLVAAKRPGTD